MSTKRFKAMLHQDEILAHPSAEAYKWSGECVLATDFDSLGASIGERERLAARDAFFDGACWADGNDLSGEIDAAAIYAEAVAYVMRRYPKDGVVPR